MTTSDSVISANNPSVQNRDYPVTLIDVIGEGTDRNPYWNLIFPRKRVKGLMDGFIVVMTCVSPFIAGIERKVFWYQRRIILT